jgi:hypothetical protein
VKPTVRPPRDPWRRAFALLYWLFAIGLGTSVALGATLGAFTHPEPVNGRAVPVSVQADDTDGRRCAQELRTLHDALLAQAGKVFAGAGANAADGVDVRETWALWSKQWRGELDTLRADCRLDEAESLRHLARLADGLGRLDLAYTTAVLGFSDVGRRKLVEVRSALDGLSPP